MCVCVCVSLFFIGTTKAVHNIGFGEIEVCGRNNTKSLVVYKAI